MKTLRIALLSAAALTTPQIAWAQCLPSGPTSFICIGTNTTPQLINSSNVTVGTAPGFSIDVPASPGSALAIIGAGNIRYLDYANSSLTGGREGLLMQTTGASGDAGSIVINANGPITGGGTGISTINNTSGATDIIVNGAIVGASSYGILATNLATTTSLTVNAGAVSGGITGIATNNFGTSATWITARGDVIGTTGHGISARNFETATDLTVNAVTASGGISGISVINAGIGATAVTATGLVAGTSNSGISAENAATATNMTINAQAASGGTTGISAVNRGTGATAVTATGLVAGTASYGISAENAATATNMTVNAQAVSGGMSGILAVNRGTGLTSVTATGLVQGGDTGIVAGNDITGIGLTVNTASVSGGTSGIVANNFGTGSTAVTSTGTVVGTSSYGILAGNLNAHPATTTNLTVDAAAVSGGITGIAVNNSGTGATSVTTRGDVVGTSGHGISARNFETATDVTVNAVTARGGDSGIVAVNLGTGATAVTATGVIAGTSNYGISAENAATATSMTINAQAASGGSRGVSAINRGTGLTLVTATDLVRGGETGILAQNITTATSLTVNAAAVSGGDNGIVAANLGTGSTAVTATGTVGGGANYGIYVENAATATSLTVNAAGVSGGYTGIVAFNRGNGATSVTATGAVVGTSSNGIDIGNRATGTNLIVNAASVSGGRTGILAANIGTGTTSISASGIVQGGTSAISASANNQAVDLQFAATSQVRNASLSPMALAVVASGSSVSLGNAGRLTGAVQLTGANNLMTNTGTWSTAGATNTLGGPMGQLVNTTTGVILAGQSAGTAETTQFQGTGTFTNRGTMSLRDGTGGDVARFSGNASFAATSVQAVDVGNGQSDKVVVDGTAILSGSLAVSKAGGYQVGTRYTVLTATGGLNGRYSALTGDAGQISSFFSVVDAYDANNAYLDVTQIRGFAAAALTPNQIAVANGAQSLPVNSVLFNAIGTLQSDGAARLAFDQLSGEAHASARTALYEGNRMVRDSALGRLRSAFGGPQAAAPSTAQVASYGDDCGPQTCQVSTDATTPSRYAVWAQGLGSWGTVDGDGNAAGLSRSTAGFLVGADAQVLDVARIGLFTGYTRTSFNVADRQSSGGSDNIHLGLYGGAQWGPIGLRLGTAYSWHTLSNTRSVAFPGFTDTLRANYTGGTFQAFGELGYRVTLDRVTLEPFGNLAYANLTTNGFSENGGAAALSAFGNSMNVTTTTLGLRSAASFMLGDAPSQIRGMVGWQHAFGDVTPLANLVLAGGSPFTVSGVPIARNSALVEVGLDVRLSEKVSLGATYTGQFASGTQDQAVRANVTLDF